MLKGFSSPLVVVLMALFVTLSVGCASRRGCRSCDAHSSGKSSAQPRSSEYYEHHAATTASRTKQKNCPVTGEALGSMGKPIPVSVHGEMILVCCQGCVAAVKKDPEKYLAIVRAEQ